MLFLLFLFTPPELAAHSSNSRGYELESAISLQCKETDWREDMLNTSCAIAAVREAFYNFGFVIHVEKCLVCRPSGMIGDDNVLEISITGSLSVDGEKYQTDLSRVSYQKGPICHA